VECEDAIVEPHDVDGLARAIKRMIDDPDLRERCARTGRTRVKEEFIWDKIVDQTLEVYEQILGRRA
jgi:glycosyltransferase involved in cell wall biosynthesis